MFCLRFAKIANAAAKEKIFCKLFCNDDIKCIYLTCFAISAFKKATCVHIYIIVYLIITNDPIRVTKYIVLDIARKLSGLWSVAKGRLIP